MMRVDPHALPIGPSGRPRLDRLRPVRERIDPHAAFRARERGGSPHSQAQVLRSRPLHRASDTSPMILVVLPETEPWPRAAADMLGTAREIFSAHCIALVSFGAPGCEPKRDGADRVLAFPEGQAEAAQLAQLDAALSLYRPEAILLPEEGGGDLARRLAARRGLDAALGVVAMKRGAVVLRCDGGRRETSRALAPLMTLRRSACAALESQTGYEALPLAVPIAEADEPFADAGTLPMSAAELPLSEAQLILSAGAGIKQGWSDLNAAAAALGAAVGGSRVVCDAGDLPRARQVGASGTIVEARGYVAFGISGAPQHLQGIAACRHVAAVNIDRNAPIMARAELALVADADAVLAELRKLLEAGA